MVRSIHRLGFTLIELLLVMVILAVLAGVAVPIYAHQARLAKINATKASISNIESALDAFEVSYERYPSTEENLDALVHAPASDAMDGQAFLKQVPKDAWSHAFDYRSPGAAHPESYDLHSYGDDGIDGTSDDITRDMI